MSPIDLTEFDDDYGHAEVQDKDFQPVPDGKYQAVVQRVELTRARSSGNPMLKWCLRVLGPRYAGRLLWRNSVIGSAENLKWLKTDLHTCGLELQMLSELPDRLEQLVGVTLDVTKRTRGDHENVYLDRKIARESDTPYPDAARDALSAF